MNKNFREKREFQEDAHIVFKNMNLPPLVSETLRNLVVSSSIAD